MIQRAFITQWGTVVPWSSPRLVEQDLIICRALVSIYSDPFLKEHLAFRGGTALHKLYLEPQPRYSEDIDLVQVNSEPIKETIDHLREVLSWLGEPVVKQKKHNNTLVFRVQPTDVGAGEIHLKVEINCKEHFSVFPMVLVPFSVKNDWFTGFMYAEKSWLIPLQTMLIKIQKNVDFIMSNSEMANSPDGLELIKNLPKQPEE